MSVLVGRLALYLCMAGALGGLTTQFLSWKKRKGESLAPDAPLFYSRKHGRLTNRAIQFDLDRWV